MCSSKSIALSVSSHGGIDIPERPCLPGVAWVGEDSVEAKGRAGPQAEMPTKRAGLASRRKLDGEKAKPFGLSSTRRDGQGELK